MTKTLDQFMHKHFINLPLKTPLFYSWKYGIRFEIGIPWMEHNDKINLQQIRKRSIGIFDYVFNKTDEILLITDIHCEEKDTFLQKVPTNVYRKYIKSKEVRKKLTHTRLPSLIRDEDDEDYNDMVTHRFVLSCKKENIRYRQLLTAISYKDFSHPTRILKRNYSSGYDIYFVNVSKKLVYHLYDDRGCDVIASNIEDLRQLYVECNNWILDYDREQIDLLFK